MATKIDQFNELHRKNMDMAMRLAQFSIDHSQRLMSMQADLAKALFEAGIENARAQTESRDPAQIMHLRAQYAQETTRQMISAAQEMASIGNSARAEFSRMLTEQLASGSKDIAESFQAFLKNLPGGSPNLMETMQQAVSAANSAFEQIAKISTATMNNVGEMTKKATGATKRSK